MKKKPIIDTSSVENSLANVGITVDFGTNKIPARETYLRAVASLEEAIDSEERKQAKKWLDVATEEYSLVFHLYFAQRYPHLLFEKGQDKVFWNYDDEEGVYVEVSLAEVRGYLIEVLTDEGLFSKTRGTFCTDCLARYRAIFHERGKKYEEFDIDGRYFHAKNGWLRLSDKKFTPHTPDMLSRRKSEVAYKKGAKCPRYDQFMDKDIELKPDVVRVLDQFSGLLLTDDIKHQKMLTIIGKPGSGKSTLMEVWMHVLGDMAIQKQLFELSGDRARFSGGDLIGRTMCWFDEVDVKRSEMDNSLGLLISGKYIQVERKGINGVRKAPNMLKCILTANNLPSSAVAGIYRRMFFIEFNKSFYNEEVADSNLGDKLCAEASGILNRMLRGLDDLRKMNKFTVMGGHEDAIEDYKVSSDVVAEFLDTYFEPIPNWDDDVNEPIQFIDMYSAFREFNQNNRMMLTPQRFGKMVSAQPLVRFQCIKSHRSSTSRYWTGFKLKEQYMWNVKNDLSVCIKTKVIDDTDEGW